MIWGNKAQVMLLVLRTHWVKPYRKVWLSFEYGYIPLKRSSLHCKTHVLHWPPSLGHEERGPHLASGEKKAQCAACLTVCVWGGRGAGGVSLQ